MAGECHDCSRCSEVGSTSLGMLVPRVIGAVLFGWWAGLSIKRCRICGHRMSAPQWPCDRRRRRLGSLQFESLFCPWLRLGRLRAS